MASAAFQFLILLRHTFWISITSLFVGPFFLFESSRQDSYMWWSCFFKISSNLIFMFILYTLVMPVDMVYWYCKIYRWNITCYDLQKIKMKLTTMNTVTEVQGMHQSLQIQFPFFSYLFLLFSSLLWVSRDYQIWPSWLYALRDSGKVVGT